MPNSLACDHVVAWITDYLEAVLPEESREQFDAHFAACASCRRRLRQMEWTIDHLARLPHEPMPPGMKAELLQALHSRQSA